MRGRARRCALAAAAALAVAGCLPAAVTAEGRAVARLYDVFFGVGIFVGVLVFALATFAIIRYRARGRDELPEQIHGSTRLETIWTGIPIVAILVLFGLTLLVLDRTEATSTNPGASIQVEAFRWGWRFSYPDQGVEVSGIGDPGPEIVVPVGEPVRLTMTSADVIHAFFVPEFLFKRDVIPGRENVFDFTVEEPGTYRGQCAEFCGIYHSRMPFSIRAVSRPDYDAWLATAPRGGASPSVGAPLESPAGAAPSASQPAQSPEAP